MGTFGLLKRAIPFFATFAFGLFIASFFVSISPRFERHERGRCHRDMWEMRIENEQLREENQRLRHDSIREFEVVPPVYLEKDDMEAPSIDEPIRLGKDKIREMKITPPPPPAVKSHDAHTR